MTLKGSPNMTVSRHELLREYSAYLRRTGHVDTAAAALRTRSRLVQDAMAYIATYDRYTVSDLGKFQQNGNLSEITFRDEWLAALGRVCALQAFQATSMETHEKEVSFGLSCLESANKRLPHVKEYAHYRRLEVELHTHQGNDEQAMKLVHNDEHLRTLYYGYIPTDLKNPNISGSAEQYSEWLAGFNRPFVENGLLPIDSAPSSISSFEELKVSGIVPRDDKLKVTVIMTSYKPAREVFLLAVRSILNQTWRNIELLIVDDASPNEYKEVLDSVRALDSRIRVIELPKNGGTYRARNVGVSEASGDFITGQDSDDWSHPERIAQQVNFLLKNSSSPGAVVEAIRMNDDLVRMFPGRKPHRLCEVSLMLRPELAKEVGGYLDARKGADSEFRRRIEGYTGQEVQTIEKPLYLTRIGHESLSGADFKPGWSHPVRRAFWNASEYWHENTPRELLSLATAKTTPIPVPNRFKITSPAYGPHFDVVFIGDWRSFSGVQRGMVDEITALADRGRRVGIMHLESLMSPSKQTTRLCGDVQVLINQGYIEEIIPDENASSEVAVIKDPTILQFAPNDDINFVAQTTLISAEIPPPGNAAEPLYQPADCHENAKSLFNGEVIWTSVDPSIHHGLTTHQPRIRVHPLRQPVAFKTQRWLNNRSKLAGGLPILGRHAENLESLWPNSIETTNQLWPADDNAEVRILGDARALLRKHNKRRYPPTWVNFRDEEIKPEAFMSCLDFFVYYPAEDYAQSFSREALEASASGALVILPKNFEKMHGRSAVYASPSEVSRLIHSFTQDRTNYQKTVQSNTSALKKTYSNENYVEYIHSIETTSVSTKHPKLENHAHS